MVYIDIFKLVEHPFLWYILNHHQPPAQRLAHTKHILLPWPSIIQYAF
jgi:hypothetical protein